MCTDRNIVLFFFNHLAISSIDSNLFVTFLKVTSIKYEISRLCVGKGKRNLFSSTVIILRAIKVREKLPWLGRYYVQWDHFSRFLLPIIISAKWVTNTIGGVRHCHLCPQSTRLRINILKDIVDRNLQLYPLTGRPVRFWAFFTMAERVPLLSLPSLPPPVLPHSSNCLCWSHR